MIANPYKNFIHFFADAPNRIGAVEMKVSEYKYDDTCEEDK